MTSFQVSRSSASGGGASPWNCSGCGLRASGVLPLGLRVVHAEREQRRRADLAAQVAEHGHLVAVVQRMIGRGPLVAQRREKLPEPFALQGQPLSAAALALEVPAEPHVVAGQGAQRGVGRPPPLGLHGLPPAVHRRPDVAAEYLRQVVVAVELVFVVDAGEGGGGRGGHGSTPSSRSRLPGPARAGTRTGCA